MGYIAYLIEDKDRFYLANGKDGPTHDKLVAHHITYKFGVKKDYPLPSTPKVVEIVGYNCDEFVEVFVVRIDGTTERLDGGTYHVTWSLDSKGGKTPAYSNELLKKGWIKVRNPVRITVSDAVFLK